LLACLAWPARGKRVGNIFKLEKFFPAPLLLLQIGSASGSLYTGNTVPKQEKEAES
jgi:hypothetical protein